MRKVAVIGVGNSKSRGRGCRNGSRLLHNSRN